MSIQLNDKSNVSARWIQGRCKITFHALNKALVLPVGMEVTIELIETLYAAYKTK